MPSFPSWHVSWPVGKHLVAAGNQQAGRGVTSVVRRGQFRDSWDAPPSKETRRRTHNRARHRQPEMPLLVGASFLGVHGKDGQHGHFDPLLASSKRTAGHLSRFHPTIPQHGDTRRRSTVMISRGDALTWPPHQGIRTSKRYVTRPRDNQQQCDLLLPDAAVLGDDFQKELLLQRHHQNNQPPLLCSRLRIKFKGDNRSRLR